MTTKATAKEWHTLQDALALWGPVAQTIMVFEEMSELQKELCKNRRGKNNTSAIAEEIADVQIMLQQMIILHDCEKLVDGYTEAKMLRLAERIKESAAARSKPTNADVIRSMSEDGLVDTLLTLYKVTISNGDGSDLFAKWCDSKGGCMEGGEEVECDDEKHRACIRRWLRREAG